MNYLISDIHGNLDAFRKVLAKASFGKNDNLYIVGGIIDYGHESIELIQDLMVRNNVFAIMGKHEFSMLRFLKNMQKKANGEELSDAANAAMVQWFSDGGSETAQKLMELSEDDREAICDFLEDMDVYLEFEIDEENYLCVPSGIRNYDSDKELDDYDYSDILEATEEDTKIVVDGTILVTGQYPVRQPDGRPAGRIDADDNHLRLDCGAACGGRLGMICIETGECFYVEVE